MAVYSPAVRTEREGSRVVHKASHIALGDCGRVGKPCLDRAEQKQPDHLVYQNRQCSPRLLAQTPGAYPTGNKRT